jgi:hypothetical protein
MKNKKNVLFALLILGFIATYFLTLKHQKSYQPKLLKKAQVTQVEKTKEVFPVIEIPIANLKVAKKLTVEQKRLIEKWQLDQLRQKLGKDNYGKFLYELFSVAPELNFDRREKSRYREMLQNMRSKPLFATQVIQFGFERLPQSGFEKQRGQLLEAMVLTHPNPEFIRKISYNELITKRDRKAENTLFKDQSVIETFNLSRTTLALRAQKYFMQREQDFNRSLTATMKALAAQSNPTTQKLLVLQFSNAYPEFNEEFIEALRDRGYQYDGIADLKN